MGIAFGFLFFSANLHQKKTLVRLDLWYKTIVAVKYELDALYALSSAPHIKWKKVTILTLINLHPISIYLNPFQNIIFHDKYALAPCMQ